MVKPPAFQFYADDFVAGTVDLTPREIGSYILLLCYQWSKGYVPDNDESIRRICRETNDLDLVNIRCKFVSRRGRLFNVRLEKERQKQKLFRTNRSVSGAKGAKSRWHSHESANSTAMQQPLAKHGSPSPSPSPSPDNILCASAAPSTPSKFKKPEQSELELYAAKIGLPVLEINKFVDYYESNGWRVGRNPMKSWQAAMRNWKHNLQIYRGGKKSNSLDLVGGNF